MIYLCGSAVYSESLNPLSRFAYIFYKKMAGNLKEATIFFRFPATTYSYK